MNFLLIFSYVLTCIIDSAPLYAGLIIIGSGDIYLRPEKYIYMILVIFTMHTKKLRKNEINKMNIIFQKNMAFC